MKKKSKRYIEIAKKKKNEKVSVEKIFDLVKETCTTKFDESVDVSLKLNIKQSKGGDFNLRTVVKLPNSNGFLFFLESSFNKSSCSEFINLNNLFEFS